MGAKVKVKFLKSYIAARGPGIAGSKGAEREYPMTPALQQLVNDGIVELVREAKPAKRETAKKKDAKE